MKISENMGHDGNIIYKWWIMYCHVWLPEGKSPPMGIDHHTSLGRFATSQDTLWKSTENPWKPAFSTAKSVCRWSSINVLWFPYNVVLQEFSSCSIGPKKNDRYEVSTINLTKLCSPTMGHLVAMSNPVIFQGPHPSEAMSCLALASGPPHHPIGITMVSSSQLGYNRYNYQYLLV